MATAIVDSCTSLVSNVLDYHITSMIDDGFIEKAWKNHLSRHGTIECVQDSKSNGWFDEADTFSLTIVDVGGIFIVHVVLSLVSITIAIYQFYVKSKKGLLPESRNLKHAFGIEFARKKLLRSEGRRSLVMNDGGRSDKRDSDWGVSEAGSNTVAVDSSAAAAENFDDAFDDEENDANTFEISSPPTESSPAADHRKVRLRVHDSRTSVCDDHNLFESDQIIVSSNVDMQEPVPTHSRFAMYRGADNGSDQTSPADEVEAEEMIFERFSM